MDFTDNPYMAPAEAMVPRPPVEVPKEILAKIKHATVTGIISGCITLVVTLFALAGNEMLGFTGLELIDVVLIFGLTFGIYKKSRTCALIMLLYFVVSKIILIAENGPGGGGGILALVFIYFYFQGVVGTFQYHKHLRESYA
jgi:hypothetical protein